MHSAWFSDDERDFARYRERDDAGALARVFDRNAGDLLALARHLAPLGLAPEDLVQATFLTAMERRGAWDGRRRVAPWLVGILALHAREARRRALSSTVAGRATVGLEALAVVPACAAEAPPAQAVANERAAAFEALLAGLAPGDRAVLEPYLCDGASAADIGARLGLAANAVHQRVHRALRRLALRLPRTLAPAVVAGRGRELEAAALKALRARVVGHASADIASAVLSGGARAAALVSAASAALALALTAEPWQARESGSDAALAHVGPTSSVPAAALATLEQSPERQTLDDPQPPLAVPQPRPLVLRCLVQSAADSRRLPNATLWLRSDAEDTLAAQPLPADVVDGISFVARLREDELARLEVRAPGHVTWRAPRDTDHRAWAFESDLTWADNGDAVCATFNPFLSAARTLVGSVIDSAGNPVAFAELFVVGNTQGVPAPDSDVSNGRTDATGRFRLEDAAVAQPHANQGLVATYVDARGGVHVGWRTLASSGEPGGVEEVVVQLGLAHAAEVTVLDAAGAPVCGVDVVAQPAGGPWFHSHTARLLAERPLRWPSAFEANVRARTDDRGRARFPRLPLLAEPELGLHDGARVSAPGVTFGAYSFRVAATTWQTTEPGTVLVPLPTRDGEALVAPAGGVVSPTDILGWTPIVRVEPR